MKNPLIVANWKENLKNQEAANFITDLKTRDLGYKEVVICPTFISLITAFDCVSGSEIKLGTQNISMYQGGAYTGEVAASMISEFCDYVIIGHSERRRFFIEKNNTVNVKMRIALMNSLRPILCIGENLDERKSGQSEHRVAHQLQTCLSDITPEILSEVTIAYEPIWAISSGDSNHKSATAQEVQEMHDFIRKTLIKRHGQTIANQIRIIYGGSVKPHNSHELLNLQNVDGALVGNASLNVESFYKIISTSISQ